jgi:hypothetical protein
MAFVFADRGLKAVQPGDGLRLFRLKVFRE